MDISQIALITDSGRPIYTTQKNNKNEVNIMFFIASFTLFTGTTVIIVGDEPADDNSKST